MEYSGGVGPVRLLLVDDDPSVHQLVRTMLRRGGYELKVASNGEEALRIAKTWPPDLVVTDVLMPFMDGWTLVKRLRSTAETALVPVIFLTSLSSAEDYVRGFRLGADDYLDKQNQFWDLPDRVARALARRQDLKSAVAVKSTGRAPSSTGLSGNFDQIGLASLLKVLELGGQGGILRVKRSRPAEEALLYLVEGRVHRADLQVRKEIRNRDAVYSLLDWNEGAFEFSSDPLRVGDQVQMGTTELLLEGARRIDERRPRS
jgi:CheY-like chemotaxis protein